MKFYILFIALVMAVVQVKSDVKEEIRKVDRACREESHVTDADLAYLKNGKWNDEPNDAIKCHRKCVLEKLGQWKNGTLDEKAAREFLQTIPSLKDHQDVVDKSLAECKNKKGANDCDTAYLITKCLKDFKNDSM